jgi:hypothetical protein
MKEELIAKGFKTYKSKEQFEPYFYVSAIKKSYPKAIIQDDDIKKININDKAVKCVLLRNVQF